MQIKMWKYIIHKHWLFTVFWGIFTGISVYDGTHISTCSDFSLGFGNKKQQFQQKPEVT